MASSGMRDLWKCHLPLTGMHLLHSSMYIGCNERWSFRTRRSCQPCFHFSLTFPVFLQEMLLILALSSSNNNNNNKKR